MRIPQARFLSDTRHSPMVTSESICPTAVPERDRGLERGESKPKYPQPEKNSNSHFIYPLTARVVWAPQKISQPVFSIFPCSPLPSGSCQNVHSLMLSSHLFLCLPCLLPPFTVPCKMVLARPDERETWPYHCGLRLFTMVFVWSDCLLDFCTDFLVGNMVFVWDV